MNRRLIAVFLAIVLVPLAIVGWLGMRLAGQQAERADERLAEVMRANLRGFDAEIGALLDERRRAVRSALDGIPIDAETLRAETRRLPAVSQLFAVDRAGQLLHPSLMDRLPAAEEDFLQRTREIWTRRLLPGRATARTPDARGSVAGTPAADEAAAGATADAPSSGWYPWFWGGGLRLIYWWQDGDGRIVGAELDRVRLLSDVVAVLPETDPLEPGREPGRVRLVDAQGGVLYQWGAYRPADGEWPRVRLPLSHPLAAWTLEVFAADSDGGGWRGALLGLLPGVGGLAVLVVGLAFYFYRESSREMREAARRVTFVNQVSHELKTPLTNIRMYAELLEDEVDGAARRHLGVIVSESQRLSRLILNILTFSRHERRELKLRRRTGVVDDAVGALLEQFRPSLDTLGIELKLSPGAGEPVSFDADAVQQIVANLLSNVEKYAAAGGRVDVATEQAGDEVVITVRDRGPGVAEPDRERIFEPFYRPSNALSDGVTGTGIGLAIARDLARLHGGDLVLTPAEAGACFRLTLNCPPSPAAAPGDGR